MSSDEDRPETIRLRAELRTVIVRAGWVLSAVGVIAVALLVVAGAWPLAVIDAVVFTAVGFMTIVRTPRCRLEIRDGELLVANQLRTRLVRREDVVAVEVGQTRNLRRLRRTVVLVLATGVRMRIDAAATPAAAADIDLDPLVKRLGRWRSAT